uniref:N-acetylglucosamine-1-phosphodiester alpha-N-acetylglucosaminidase-like n=1 Tax=Crassostrea virginica TaxID=6565 RepID=A0A8B8AKP8_CRAVI|nr:N-acetylglucosamine-1-phosphodiester alpha-N-acetylglucosaminidase-like [Crassostrea virginica]
MCLPCEDGLTGAECRFPCPFPYFGRGCLMNCNCTFKQCPHHHPKHGCNASKGTTTNEMSTTLLQTEIRNQKDQEEQRQTTYTLKIPIVLLTTMAFILLVFHIFTYSKCFKKCIFYEK